MSHGFFIQNSKSYEAKQAIQECMLTDKKLVYFSGELDGQQLDDLARAALIPIGSVEFIQDIFKRLNVKPSSPSTYPKALKKYLNRKIYETTLQGIDINNSLFIKPCEIKRFDGFVLNAQGEYEDEQRKTIKNLDPDEPVWASPIIDIEAEYRYYILDGEIAGFARYDQSDNEDVRLVPESFVKECIKDFSKESPIAYSIDVAVLSSIKNTQDINNPYVLMEVNDAWALGYYREANIRSKYLQMLALRWQEIVSKN